MNIFERKDFRPFLLEKSEPFDSADFIFELKFDGIRAVAFLGEDKTYIINRKSSNISETTYPELCDLHKQVSANCVLDGEIIALTNGKPDFFKLQSRALNSNPIRAGFAAKSDPVQFVAFDIMHYDGRDVVDLPLHERKKLLQNVIKENERIVVSKHVEEQGRALFALAEKEGLEGIIAKRKSSLYKEGIRNGDWLKIKVRHDTDFLLAGYKFDADVDKIVSLYIAKPSGEVFGWQNYNLSKMDSEAIIKHTRPYVIDENKANGVTQLQPKLTCIVSYNEKTQSGNLRGAVYKGIRID